MKKCLSILLVLVTVCFILVGCGDDSYAGLSINDNANQIKELCRLDSTFTYTDAKEIATILANKNFKKIKKTKEYAGGTEKKIVIMDGNSMAYIIFMSNDKVTAVHSEDGNSIYIRPIKKEKKKN